MPSRKKARGLRVAKPVLPKEYSIGDQIGYFQDKLDDTLRRAAVYDPPFWTNDGYWEVLAMTGDGRLLTLIWFDKDKKWLLKTY